MTEREQFEKWLNGLPEKLSTRWEAWQAGRNSALEGLKGLAQEWTEAAIAGDELFDGGFTAKTLRRCAAELLLIEGEKKTS